MNITQNTHKTQFGLIATYNLNSQYNANKEFKFIDGKYKSV